MEFIIHGWNGLNTTLHESLQAGTRADFWTVHDPAARVASVFGSALRRRNAERQLQSALVEVETLKKRLQAESRYLSEEISLASPRRGRRRCWARASQRPPCRWMAV